jgi:hypothetical protein
MTFYTSLSLPLQHLVVIVVQDPSGNLIAYGVDPRTQKFTFITGIGNLGEFLQGVVVDQRAALTSPNAIVVPVQPPPTPWPDAQVVLALARSVSSDEQLAQLSTHTAV